MNEIEIVKKIMGDQGYSAKTLAEKIKGEKDAFASYVSNRLQSKTMTVEKLLELLNALDCELIIKQKAGSKKTYIVTDEERKSVKVYKKKDGEA